MNQIRIEEGIVLDITPSHKLGDVDYEQMNVVVKNSNNKESLLTLKYKKYDNKFYTVGSRVNCLGTIRSYSEKQDGKNHVLIYISTDFSETEPLFEDVTLYPSSAIVDGTICSIEPLRELTSGKCNIHFILANNISVESNGNVRSYNSYIPCIAWGNLAKKIAQHQIGDKILINDGELRSREYVKHSSEQDEIKLCHELYIKSYRDIKE